MIKSAPILAPKKAKEIGQNTFAAGDRMCSNFGSPKSQNLGKMTLEQMIESAPIWAPKMAKIWAFYFFFHFDTHDFQICTA